MFLITHTVIGRTKGKTRGRAEIPVIERKRVIRSTGIVDAFFGKPSQEASIFMKKKQLLEICEKAERS
jgi:hypothetical protein